MRTKDLTIEIIASEMELSPSELWALARNLERHFWPTRYSVVRDKLREIDAPKPEAKRRLRMLHRFVQREFRSPQYVHGGVRGRCCFSSANQHLGKRYVVTRDIKDCYPSISSDSLRRSLLKLGFRSDVARLLTMLMTLYDRIPQGSPVSSDALNLFLAGVDRSLADRCRSTGARYSRVYDDLVVSTDSRENAERIGTGMDAAIAGAGLRVNESKKRKSGLQPSHHRQRVHNIGVNRKAGTQIVEEHRRNADEMAQDYVHAARRVTPNSFQAVVKKRERLHGMICHCQQARFSPARHLKRLLAQGDQLVSSRLSADGIEAPKGKWWVSSKKTSPKRISERWTRKRKK